MAQILSEAQAVEPGDSCQILCRPPFHGAGAAHCPEHNVDPARPRSPPRRRVGRGDLLFGEKGEEREECWV